LASPQRKPQVNNDWSAAMPPIFKNRSIMATKWNKTIPSHRHKDFVFVLTGDDVWEGEVLGVFTSAELAEETMKRWEKTPIRNMSYRPHDIRYPLAKKATANDVRDIV
jgi:hypothetical protein